MAKRVFRVNFGGYGGELVIGKVTADFVEYWKQHIANGEMSHLDNSARLVNHLRGLEWGDENVDGDSPSLREGGVNPPWNEVDDLEHLWAAYSDGGFTVAEVTGLDGDERHVGGDAQPFEHDGSFYSREAYFGGDLPEASAHLSQEEIDAHFVPVLLFHTSEKGDFGCVFVETEDGADFDPKKFAFTVCENNYFAMIDRCFYDRRMCEVETGFSSTSGSVNGDHAMVGYFNMKCHDPRDRYTEEYLTKNHFWVD